MVDGVGGKVYADKVEQRHGTRYVLVCVRQERSSGDGDFDLEAVTQATWRRYKQPA